MKVQILGSSYLSHYVVEHVLQSSLYDKIELDLITRRFINPTGDQISLESHNHAAPVRVIHHPSSQEEIASAVTAFGPDLFFCLGWNFILDSNVLSLARIANIGYHPTLLPKNRGRHPLIWAIVLGLAETGSTFFRLTSEPDSGSILSQEVIRISASEDATSLYSKVVEVACNQFDKILFSALEGSELIGTKQDEDAASYWRKRSRADGTIDPRMGAEEIAQLVRALKWPYPGAEVVQENGFMRYVRDCRINTMPLDRSIEPGRVLDCEDLWVLIKAAGQSSIWLQLDGFDHVETLKRSQMIIPTLESVGQAGTISRLGEYP